LPRRPQPAPSRWRQWLAAGVCAAVCAAGPVLAVSQATAAGAAGAPGAPGAPGASNGSVNGLTDHDNEYLLAPQYRGEPLRGLVPVLVAEGRPPLVAVEDLLDALNYEFEVLGDGGIVGQRHPGDLPFAFSVDGGWRLDRQTGVLGPAAFRLVAGVLHLTPQALAQVVPVELAVDTVRQLLEIRATGPLPLDLLQSRELALARLGTRGATQPPPLEPFPYGPFGRPAGDARANLTHNTTSDGDTNLSYSGLVVSEVGYLTGLMSFSGRDDELRDARLRLGRESAGGDAFGLPGLVSGFAGDVSGDSVPLVGSQIGRGVALSSMPLTRPDSFDQTTLEGDAPPDWEVELYRGNDLLAFGRVGPDGRWVFPDVPLLFGENVLRVVVYGPEGQVREERRELPISASLAPPGQLYWSAFAGQRNRSLLEPLLPERDQPAQGVYALAADIGLNTNLGVGLFATRAPESFERDADVADTRGARLQLSRAQLYLELDAARQQGGGQALGVSGSTGLGRLSLAGRYAQYDGFRSQRATRSARGLDREGRLIANLPVQVLGRNIALGASLERYDFENGSEEMLYRLLARFALNGVYLTHEVERRAWDYASGQNTARTDWISGLSTSVGQLRLALQARVDLDDTERSQLQARGNWRLDPQTTANFGISANRSADGDQVWSQSAGVSRDFGGFRANVGATRGADGNWFFGLGINTSFGMDRDGRLSFSGSSLAERGAADVFVFHDRDFDGRYDPVQDELLPEAGIVLNDSQRTIALTGGDGRAFVAGLDTRAPAQLGVDPTSVPDPFLIPADDRRFMPRAGQPFVAEIALVDSGEISGRLTVERNGQDIALSAVMLELVRLYEPHAATDDGVYLRVIKVQRTRQDGEFFFDLVPPGQYLVRIREGQQIRGAPIEPAEMLAVVTPDALYVEDLELRLIAPPTMVQTPLPTPANGQAL
jgi:hypothetical protein